MRNYPLQDSGYIRLKRHAPTPRYLDIGATRSTPRIEFLPEKEYLMIEGVSNPENATAFYDQLLRKLHAYAKSGNTKLSVNVNLQSINTGSSKALMNLFKILYYLQEHEILILINWFHEDMDILEAGRDFGLFFELKMNFVSLHIER